MSFSTLPKQIQRYRYRPAFGEDVCTHALTLTHKDMQMHVWLLQAMADRDIKRNCGNGWRVATLSHQISLTTFDHTLFLLSFYPSLFTPSTRFSTSNSQSFGLKATSLVVCHTCFSFYATQGLKCLLKLRRGRI